jgi:hypothetical protein
LGSGLKGRRRACLFFKSDEVIQAGLTTLIMLSRAAEYWGKSLVVDMIWVTFSRSILLSSSFSEISPECSSRVTFSCEEY